MGSASIGVSSFRSRRAELAPIRVASYALTALTLGTTALLFLLFAVESWPAWQHAGLHARKRVHLDEQIEG